MLGRNLVDILRHRSDLQGPKKVFAFLQDGEEESDSFTFEGLDLIARSIACLLKDSGAIRGDRVLMIYSPGISFIAAFYGCLYGGMIAVPVKPPSKRQSLQHVERIARDCLPALILTDKSAGEEIIPRLAESEWLLALKCIVSDRLDDEKLAAGAGLWSRPDIDDDSLAFLQYTSGSTGVPKGVCISHSNVISNMQMINAAFGHDENTLMAGWLPLFHDMGLVGNVMQPVYNGFLSVLMPPVAFLQKPMRWLRMISRYEATSSGGPNFGYELCNTRFRAEQLEGVDLRNWKVAYNGAEPIRAGTIRRFSNLFSAYGFHAASHHPCYGMAETTLIAAGGWIEEEPKIICIDRRAMEDGIARPLPERQRYEDSEEVIEVVRCGKSILDQDIQIMDPVKESLCEAGRIGEIWISGSNISKGYWRREDSNPDVFEKGIEGKILRRYLRTGDLGFLLNDELYVCGRIKDIMIIKGRNYFPNDVEQCAEESHEGFVLNGSVAFISEEEGESRLVLIMEVKRVYRNSIKHGEYLMAVRKAITAVFEIPVYDLVLIDEMTLPKTFSGKLRRSHCRQLYLEGGFRASLREPDLSAK
jgi:acyl-CoA synthetase (AMP-forming)/AMP-acid ligase II